MALSGSSDFNMNRNEIVLGALRKLGILAEGETATATQINDAVQDLNMMVKMWNAQGLHLWKYQEITIFTEVGKAVYKIGKTGDRAAPNVITNKLAADVVADALTITLDDNDGFDIADNIGIVLDAGTIFWSTISDIGNLTTFTEDFDDATGLTFDASKVTLTEVAGQAALALLDNSLQTFNQSFTSSTGFTFDASKTEFTAGVAQQKDTTPTDSRLGATYTSVTDASWNKDGSTTGTLNGSPTISGNKLICTGTQGVYYAATEDGTAAIKIKYTPNYTGAPPANINVISLWNGTNNNNRILVTHSPTGDTLRITLNDSTGTSVIAVATIIGASPSFVAGTEYEIEFNWDNGTGDVRLFLDGALHGTLSPGAWTHGTGSTRVYAGAVPVIYDRAEADYADVVLFNTVQHTGAYTAGYTLPETIYVTDVVTLPTFTYGGAGSIQSFDAYSTTDTNVPHYVLNGEYWNGAAWVASSDTYATASTEADINTNVDTITVSDTLIIKVIWDDNNSTQMLVDDLTVTYTGQADYTTDNPPVAIDAAITGDIKTWNSFTIIDTIPASDSITYILSDDDSLTYKYWDGLAWVVSDGTFAQSITKTVLNSNISTFPITVRGMKIKLFLHSNDGTTTPSIDNLVVNYNIGNNVTLNDKITGAASTSNFVYGYTALTVRPLQILDTRLKINDGNEIPMLGISRDTYFDLPNKTTQGNPTQFYYNPLLTNGNFYVWPTSSTVNNVINATTTIPIEDFDNITDDPDFPQEWLLPLVFNLAVILAPDYGISLSEGRGVDILARAQASLEEAESFDRETSSIFFSPSDEDREGWE